MRSIIIEVCIDSVESAIAAVQGGADRLEVCSNLGLGGGTTPSVGLIKSVQRVVPGIPIMAMVRTRTGDFCYSDAEMKVMHEDINSFKQLGITGVAVGILKKDGSVDVFRCRNVVTLASPMEVCFHRAFDMTLDPVHVIYSAIKQFYVQLALQDVASIGGISRILTSGHGPSALESLPTLATLLNTAKLLNGNGDSKLVIMPGSGIKPSTIETIMRTLLPLGLKEIHLSAGSWEEGKMEHRPSGMGMGIGSIAEWGVWRTSQDIVREVRDIVDTPNSL